MPIFSPGTNANSPFASLKGDHAGVRVPDLGAALAWYCEKLDFRLVGTTEANGMTFALVAPAADDTFQIELLAGPGADNRPSHKDLGESLSLHGWHHLAFRVDDVDQTLAALQRRGVKIIQEAFDNAELQRRLAFFEDPWGNVFEVTEPLAG